MKFVDSIFILLEKRVSWFMREGRKYGL
ncbi:MAG: hypothetical protein E7586_06800 [Ruminococcaceae bacterium]|nr:hypothetical protein [Oscillospiraceae bacterium]